MGLDKEERQHKDLGDEIEIDPFQLQLMPGDSWETDTQLFPSDCKYSYS